VRLEAIRVLTNALTDGTTGVNARLAAVPLDAGDPIPPTLGLITDETRNSSAARGQLPELDAQFPCLLVGLHDAGNRLDAHQHQGVRDGTVHLLIRYAARQKDSKAGARDAYYTFRAVERCITAWLNGVDTARTMNSVVVWFGEAADIAPLWDPIGDNVMTGGMLLAFRVRDLAP